MKKDKGFTILEVMIAIVIFGFLMTMVAQVMNGEIRILNTVSRQSEIEQKARTAMVHILDEIKLNRYTYYTAGSGGYDEGVYTQEPGQPRRALINLNPSEGTQGVIFYFSGTKELWYVDPDTSSEHLIADNIAAIDIFPETSRLLRIHVKASDPTGGAEYELLTWSRTY